MVDVLSVAGPPSAAIARDVVDVLRALGGAAPLGRLREHGCGWDKVQRAVALGEVERLARGRYALAGSLDARAVAVQAAGFASHLSAAQLWGLELARVPRQPHVTVDRSRGRVRAPGAVLHWADLTDDAVGDHLTSPLRTVLDCARTLPFDEALSVADSALRQGLVEPAQLQEAVRGSRARGMARARRVVRYADWRAANPFESQLRALALDAGLAVVPQVELTDGVPAARVKGTRGAELALTNGLPAARVKGTDGVAAGRVPGTRGAQLALTDGVPAARVKGTDGVAAGRVPGTRGAQAGLADGLPAARIGVNGGTQVDLVRSSFAARVDLADVGRRLVLEADSYEFHGNRTAFAADCQRYDELALDGWLVLRLAWPQVTFDQPWVRSVLLRAAARPRRPLVRSRIMPVLGPPVPPQLWRERQQR